MNMVTLEEWGWGHLQPHGGPAPFFLHSPSQDPLEAGFSGRTAAEHLPYTLPKEGEPQPQHEMETK